MSKSFHRQRELDFLRGAAIILVILRHQYLFVYGTNMGWIGVDLFFVLSGFLVSGLLFREYLKYGDIQPVNFLIRRGFKIYPIYYIFYIPYLILILISGRFTLVPFLSDMFFVQNYVNTWGYAYPASWSLAVEEHFYFGLAIFMAYAINNKKLKLNQKDSGIITLPILIFVIMIICLVLRFIQNYNIPADYAKTFTMTHLRIDSLLAGVLVSYFYHFRLDIMKKIFAKTKNYILIFVVVLISFTPFLEPMSSYFERTIGFSLLYAAFSLLLIYFLLTEDINEKLDKVFTKYIADKISKVGIYSYSIYIIHTFIIIIIEKVNLRFKITSKSYILFAIVFFLSIFLGKVMTEWVENFFLEIRNKYYPNRLPVMKPLA